jgi:hypothetical protein
MFFNLPYVHKGLLEKTWKQGYAQVKSVYRVKNLARYMTKYMVKGFDDVRLEGKKRYFASKNLLKPIVLREYEVVEPLIASLPYTKRTNYVFIKSPYLGDIEYTEHRIPPDLNFAFKIPIPVLSPPRQLYELVHAAF